MILHKNYPSPSLPSPRFFGPGSLSSIVYSEAAGFCRPLTSPSPLTKSNPKRFETEPFFRDDFLIKINVVVCLMLSEGCVVYCLTPARVFASPDLQTCSTVSTQHPSLRYTSARTILNLISIHGYYSLQLTLSWF